MKIDTVKLRIAMARSSMNIADLAIVSGLSCNTIAAYTSGNRTPTTKNLGVISHALGVDVTELLKEQED